MILEAYAKINWSLDITGVREDGYHLMDMIMQPVSLSDEIILEPASSLSITTGGWPPSRADETNLAYRAALALKYETGYNGGARIHVQKKIPIGAGMGGGSTDAAAVLYGLNRMWNTELSAPDLERIGLALGADVPFFIRGGLARSGGIGEKLESLPCSMFYPLLVLQPESGLSTGAVFKAYHEKECTVGPSNELAQQAIFSGQVAELSASFKNVLEPVSRTICP